MAADRVTPIRKGKTKLPSDLLGEIGVSGTRAFAGYIQDDFNPGLQGLKGIATFDQMRRTSGTVQALLLATELPIRAARWYVEPASDDPKHVETADFIHDSLFSFGRQTFDDQLRFALGMVWCGFSWAEKVFALNPDGKVMWERFADRMQTTVLRWNLKPGSSEELDSITQMQPPSFNTKDIPFEKVLLYTFRREGSNFAGFSVLRAAYKHWYIVDYLTRVANIGFERMTGGLPVINLKGDFDTKEVALARSIVESLRMGDEQAGVVKPDNMDLEIIEAGGRTMGEIRAYMDWHETMILRSGLAQYLALGSGNVGSFALSEDQSSLFLMSLTSTADQYAETVNYDAIPQLLGFNFGDIPLGDRPKLAHGKIGQRDIKWFGRALGALVTAGLLTPGTDLEEHIRELLELPDIPEEQTSLPVNAPAVEIPPGQQPPPQAVPGQVVPPGQPPQLAPKLVPAPGIGPNAVRAANHRRFSDPWRPSNRMRRLARPYVIKTAMPTREQLNAKAERQVKTLERDIISAWREARRQAIEVAKAKEPVQLT